MGKLSIREAALKYGMSASTLSDYVAAGLVRVAETPARRGDPKMLFEADVARVAQLRTPGAGRGRRARLRDALISG